MSIVILTKDLYGYSMAEIFTDGHREYINKQITKALTYEEVEKRMKYER